MELLGGMAVFGSPTFTQALVSPCGSPSRLYLFIFPTTAPRTSLSSTSSPTLVLSRLFITAILTDGRWYHRGADLHFPDDY